MTKDNIKYAIRTRDNIIEELLDCDDKSIGRLLWTLRTINDKYNEYKSNITTHELPIPMSNTNRSMNEDPVKQHDEYMDDIIAEDTHNRLVLFGNGISRRKYTWTPSEIALAVDEFNKLTDNGKYKMSLIALGDAISENVDGLHRSGKSIVSLLYRAGSLPYNTDAIHMNEVVF